jgi:hypothetical protein
MQADIESAPIENRRRRRLHRTLRRQRLAHRHVGRHRGLRGDRDRSDCSHGKEYAFHYSLRLELQ